MDYLEDPFSFSEVEKEEEEENGETEESVAEEPENEVDTEESDAEEPEKEAEMKKRRWWRRRRSGAGRGDEEEEEVVREEEFAKMVERCGSVMLMELEKRGTEEGKFALEDVAQQAEEDWERDSNGKDGLDRERFYWTWFELADMYTRSMEPEAYVNFLGTMLLNVVTLSRDGKPAWKRDREVSEAPTLTEPHRPIVPLG